MKVQKFTQCREFLICTGFSTEDFNAYDAKFEMGEEAQYVYFYSGHATFLWPSNPNSKVLIWKDDKFVEEPRHFPGTKSTGSVEKEFFNIENLYGDKVEVSDITSTLSWLSINPINPNQRFDAELLRENTTKSITGTDKRIYVVCIDGKITCNDKELDTLKYVRIPEEKTIEITVPEKSAAIIVTAR